MKIDDHDIHVSVSDITLEEGVATVDIRLFTDDVFNAVFGSFSPEDFPEEQSEIDESIQKYISKRLSINRNGESVKMEFVSHEIGREAIWSHFKFNCTQDDATNVLEIKNKLLIDLFDDQTNIVNIHYKDKKKVVSFNRKSTQKSVEF